MTQDNREEEVDEVLKSNHLRREQLTDSQEDELEEELSEI
jgi:hypothetical protein